MILYHGSSIEVPYIVELLVEEAEKKKTKE